MASGSAMYCRCCGATRVPALRRRGSTPVAVGLYLCGIVPGLLYDAWRRGSAEPVCRACHRPGLVPTSSPFAHVEEGQAAEDSTAESLNALADSAVVDGWAEEGASPEGEAEPAPVQRFRVDGTDRTTGMAVTEYIAADTANEARKMAELVGIAVVAIAPAD